MKSSLKNDNRGAALVAVIMAMLVLTLLGASALSMTTSNLKNGIKERDFQAAYYIAEAGASYYTEYFKNKVLQIYNYSDIDSSDSFFNKIPSDKNPIDSYYKMLLNIESGHFDEQYGKDSYAEIILKDVTEFYDNSEKRTFMIESKGFVGDISRTVYKTFSVMWVAKHSGVMTIYTKDKLTLNNNTEIKGPIGIADKDKLSVGKNVRHEEVIEIPFSEYEKSIPTAPIVQNYNSLPFPKTISNDILVLTEEVTYVNKIDYNNNINLTIKHGEEDKLLVIDEINLGNNCNIYFEGTGKIQLLLRESISIGNNFKFNPVTSNEADRIEAANKVTLFYDGDDNLFIQNNLAFNASIVVTNGKSIIFKNNSGFTGEIFTNGSVVEIKNNAYFTGAINAPNANISIGNNGTIKGNIIANSATLENNAKIVFNSNSDTTDISPEELISDITPVREK